MPVGSGTVATILVLGDYPDHHRARGLFRPLSCSGLSRPPLCSGTVPTTSMLGDCPDYGYSQGFIVFPMLRSRTAPTTLRPLLGDHSPWLHVICTHIQLRDTSLDLAIRLIFRLPASSGTTSVRCTCRCILYRLYDDSFLNLTGNSF